jgi:hypothetical protein
MPAFIDLTGQKLSRWLVLANAPKITRWVKWICVCECGNFGAVISQQLREGTSASCGCWKSEATSARMSTHALSSHRLYRRWKNMIERCENPAHIGYDDYGGRGIVVCASWKESVQAFIDDMASSYEEGLVLDRRNNDGPYSKENRRWVDWFEQAHNKRNNRFVETKWGRKTVAEASRLSGIDPGTLRCRMANNDEDIFRPVKRVSALECASLSSAAPTKLVI